MGIFPGHNSKYYTPFVHSFNPATLLLPLLFSRTALPPSCRWPPTLHHHRILIVTTPPPSPRRRHRRRNRLDPLGAARSNIPSPSNAGRRPCVQFLHKLRLDTRFLLVPPFAVGLTLGLEGGNAGAQGVVVDDFVGGLKDCLAPGGGEGVGLFLGEGKY